MIINNIYSAENRIVSNNKINRVTFKSSFRSVYNDNFSLKYNTNTCFFRNDLKWGDFAEYLYQKYKNVDKVNVIDYASSTGEEPTSLVMILDSKLGKEAEKFYPLRAYDIDEENIKRAKNGVFDVTKDELNLLKSNIGDNLNKYFICHIDKNELQGRLRLIQENIHKVVYKKSDIIQDINKISSKNTVLLCRNFLPYMKIGEQKDLIKQIAKRLDSSSIVVLGKFEIDFGIEKLFEKQGFKHTEQYNVMEKLPNYKVCLERAMRMFKLK